MWFWFCLAGTVALLVAGGRAWLPLQRWSEQAIRADLPDMATEDDTRLVCLEIAISPDLQTKKVILLGTSAMGHGLPGPSQLETDWQAMTGQAMGFERLSTNGQNLLESLFLLYRANPKPGQIVILGLSPRSLARPVDITRKHLKNGYYLESPEPFARAFRDRLPFLDAYLDKALLRKAHLRALQRRIVNAWQYRLREFGLTHLFPIPHTGQDDLYTLFPPRTSTKSKVRLNLGCITREMREDFPRYASMNLDILKAMADYVIRERGADLWVVEHPRSPDIQVPYAIVEKDYQGILAGYLAETGVRYLHIDPPEGFPLAEIPDLIHLSPQGRRDWSRRLLDRLAAEGVR
jgi:hypothetical protein